MAQLLRRMHVALHPFPYGGAKTAWDALAAGLPLVALHGPSLRGRMGAAMLREAGLDSLVGATVGDVVATAAALLQSDSARAVAAGHVAHALPRLDAAFQRVERDWDAFIHHAVRHRQRELWRRRQGRRWRPRARGVQPDAAVLLNATDPCSWDGARTLHALSTTVHACSRTGGAHGGHVASAAREVAVVLCGASTPLSPRPAGKQGSSAEAGAHCDGAALRAAVAVVEMGERAAGRLEQEPERLTSLSLRAARGATVLLLLLPAHRLSLEGRQALTHAATVVAVVAEGAPATAPRHEASGRGHEAGSPRVPVALQAAQLAARLSPESDGVLFNLAHIERRAGRQEAAGPGKESALAALGCRMGGVLDHVDLLGSALCPQGAPSPSPSPSMEDAAAIQLLDTQAAAAPAGLRRLQTLAAPPLQRRLLRQLCPLLRGRCASAASAPIPLWLSPAAAIAANRAVANGSVPPSAWEGGGGGAAGRGRLVLPPLVVVVQPFWSPRRAHEVAAALLLNAAGPADSIVAAGALSARATVDKVAAALAAAGLGGAGGTVWHALRLLSAKLQIAPPCEGCVGSTGQSRHDDPAPWTWADALRISRASIAHMGPGTVAVVANADVALLGGQQQVGSALRDVFAAGRVRAHVPAPPRPAPCTHPFTRTPQLPALSRIELDGERQAATRGLRLDSQDAWAVDAGLAERLLQRHGAGAAAEVVLECPAENRISTVRDPAVPPSAPRPSRRSLWAEQQLATEAGVPASDPWLYVPLLHLHASDKHLDSAFCLGSAQHGQTAGVATTVILSSSAGEAGVGPEVEPAVVRA